MVFYGMFTTDTDVCSLRVVNCGFQMRLIDFVIPEMNPPTTNYELPGRSLRNRDTGGNPAPHRDLQGQINSTLTESQTERQHTESCLLGLIQHAGQK